MTPGTDGTAQVKQQCYNVYNHNPTDAVQCHCYYKQLGKKRGLLPYFDEAQYNKEKFITRDMLKVFKFRNEKLPRTDNSINNCLIAVFQHLAILSVTT